MAKEKIQKKDSAKMKKLPSPSQPVVEKNLLAEYKDFKKEKKLLFRVLQKIYSKVEACDENIRIFVYEEEETVLLYLVKNGLIESYSIIKSVRKNGDGINTPYDALVKDVEIKIFSEKKFRKAYEEEKEKWVGKEEGAYRFKIDYKKKNKFSVFKNEKEVGSFGLSGYNLQILQVLAKAKKPLTKQEICERVKTSKFKTGKGLEGEKVKGHVKEELIPSFSTYTNRINKKLEKFSLKIDCKEFRYSIIPLN